MEWNWKKYRKEKTLFRSYYCASCRQQKPCQLLTGWSAEYKSYCCECYYQGEQERAKGYSDYQSVYQQKVKEKKAEIRQLQLLKAYGGCSQCGSLEVDAYSLYVENKLVCQPCLVRKTGSSSSPLSFSEQSKWYRQRWKVDLAERLTKFQELPVNYKCAREWAKDKGHLGVCKCLEREAKELVEIFSSSLKTAEEKLKDCKCEKSEKTRTPYYDSDNYGYTFCEKCEAQIKGAGKHGVIKNRNSPVFWGLEVKEKVLCLKCLGEFQEKMSSSKKYTFNKYLKRYINGAEHNQRSKN